MTVCLPFTGLLPHLVRAAAPVPVSDRERAQRARAAGRAATGSSSGCRSTSPSGSARPRSARTTSPPCSPATCSASATPPAAPLEVVVDGTTFAHATAGTRGPRLAALIVGTPKENA